MSKPVIAKGELGVDTIQAVEAADDGRHRICSYERRNTGRSETVDGTQSPAERVADVDGTTSWASSSGGRWLESPSAGALRLRRGAPQSSPGTANPAMAE